MLPVITLKLNLLAPDHGLHSSIIYDDDDDDDTTIKSCRNNGTAILILSSIPSSHLTVVLCTINIHIVGGVVYILIWQCRCYSTI